MHLALMKGLSEDLFITHQYLMRWQTVSHQSDIFQHFLCYVYNGIILANHLSEVDGTVRVIGILAS